MAEAMQGGYTQTESLLIRTGVGDAKVSELRARWEPTRKSVNAMVAYSDARLATQAQLTDFITNSPGFCAPLDVVARDTARDLFTAEVNAALASLASRDADLAKATATISGATTAANQSPKSIQFTQIISFLDKSKDALAQLKAIEEELASPDEDLLTKIETVMAAIEELKNARQPF